MPARLGSVLEVVYLIFTEGHAATTGHHVGASGPGRRGDAAGPRARRAAAARAGGARPGRAHGAAGVPVRRPRRRHAAAGPGPAALGQRADRARARGRSTRATALGRPLGPYTVQAAIAACHSRARTFEDTDWEAVVALYDALAQLAPSPVVELNRAVAVLHADGPEAALAALDAIARRPAPRPLPPARRRPRGGAGPAGPGRGGRRRARAGRGPGADAAGAEPADGAGRRGCPE